METAIKLFSDFGFVLYAIMAPVSLYTFILLFCWWMKGRKAGRHASEVFLYIMYLMLGLCISNVIAGYCRFLRIYNDINLLYEFTSTWLWKVRLLFIVVPLCAFAISMSIRSFGGRRDKENDIQA